MFSLLFALILLGAGCTSASPDKLVPPTEVSTTEVTTTPESVTAPSKTTVGWNTYLNRDYRYQIDVPASWITGEYSVSGSGLVDTSAFDPVAVVSLETLYTVDVAPGTVWVSATDSVPSGLKQKTLSSGVTAAYSSTRCEDDCPNPWWANKTDVRYYVSGGENKHLMIETNFPNEKEKDAAFQDTLTQILASFRFVK